METMLAKPTVGLGANASRIELAKEIFSRPSGRPDVYGPEEICAVFDRGEPDGHFRAVFGHGVPPIRFTESELRRGRELGLNLVLVPKDLSVLDIQTARENRTASGRPLFRDVDWCRQQMFFGDTDRECVWKLVGVTQVPESVGVNPVRQTRAIANCLEVMFEGSVLSGLRSMIQSFGDQEDNLNELVEGNPAGVTALLAQHPLNRHFRARPQELLLAFVLQEALTEKPGLFRGYACTNRRTTDEDCKIVRMGNFGNPAGGTLDAVPANHVCKLTGACISIGPMH